MHLSPSAFRSIVRAGGVLNEAPTNLFMRVLQFGRGEENHNPMLHGSPTRKVAWVSGGDSLMRFTRLPREKYFIEMGKSADWYRRKVEANVGLALVVFEARASTVADWGGVRAAVRHHHPAVAERLEPFWSQLASTPFSSILSGADRAVFGTDVAKDGRDEANHMSEVRFLAAEPTLRNARLFLWHTLGANEDYLGTGVVPNGFAEYLVPNVALRELGAHELIDLNPAVER
jgi:hypothetical protein